MQEILVKEFSQAVSQAQSVIAVQVYLELVQVKKYYDVEYNFNQTLNKMIITGKKQKNSVMCAFIPMAVTEYLDFSLLQKFTSAHSYPSTFLAIVASDSTTVYYQIQDGLIEPEDTTANHVKVNKQAQLDKDLEKYRDSIENAALLGIKLNIPEKAGTSSEIAEQIK